MNPTITLDQFEMTMVHMYIDYVNNFLSVDTFAKHYNLSVKGANLVISEGRKLNEILATK